MSDMTTSDQEPPRRFYQPAMQDLLMADDEVVFVPAVYTIHQRVPADGDSVGNWRLLAATQDFYSALEIAGHFWHLRQHTVEVRQADGRVYYCEDEQGGRYVKR